MLFALGIRFVGETTAKEIARHFGTIEAIASATLEQLLEVPDVGEVIAESVLEYFRDERHLDDIRRLKTAGLQFSMQTSAADSAALAGKTVVVSGTFRVSRDEMKRLVERHGGKNSSSVSSKTAFLLAGDKPGPEKMKKAAELGVRILTEAEFMNMLPELSSVADETEREGQDLTLFG